MLPRYELDRIIKFQRQCEKVPWLATKQCIARLQSMQYFTSPSSCVWHGSYEGGNADHSASVTDLLMDWTEQGLIEWENERSPVVVGLFHDLCKCGAYTKDEFGVYSKPKTPLNAHGELSAIRTGAILAAFAPKEQNELTQEELHCIWWHMGPFTEKEDWPLFKLACQEYPNVLWTHHADILSSYVVEEEKD